MDTAKGAYTSDHYLGEKGRRYAEACGGPIDIGCRLQAEFFQPFITSDDVVLDFGCGKGGIASLIECKRIDGFDINPHQLKYARQYCFATFSNYNEPAKDFYDVVISNHALEHAPSPLLSLGKVREWLKPVGRAVFVVPHDCVQDRHQRRFDPADHDHHLYTWTARSLANLFSEAGFEIELCKVLRSAWHPRLFRIHQIPFIGPLSRWLVYYTLKRPQILCVSRKPYRDFGCAMTSGKKVSDESTAPGSGTEPRNDQG